MKHGLAGAIRSVEARGYPYYHELNKQYPTHWSSFFGMHQRINQFKLDTDFPRNYQGFKDFITYLGDVPVGMIKPTVGRKDHSLGYIRGNFAWQEKDENTRESAIRNDNFSKGRPNTPSGIGNKKLLGYLDSLCGKVLITYDVVKQAGFSHRKDLYRILRKMGRLEKVRHGEYYII